MTEALSDVLKLPDKIPSREVNKRSQKIEKPQCLLALQREVSDVWLYTVIHYQQKKKEISA